LGIFIFIFAKNSKKKAFVGGYSPPKKIHILAKKNLKNQNLRVFLIFKNHIFQLKKTNMQKI
jgi:hypothetical protein